MSITKEVKQNLIHTFRRSAQDTGSSEVQIAVLTERIKNLTEHFKTHKKDNHSRRGLLILVSRRKKIISYLKRTDYPKYSKIIQDLELRK